MANKKLDVPIFSSLFDTDEANAQDNKAPDKFYQKAPTNMLSSSGTIANAKLSGKLLELSKNGKTKKKKFFVMNDERLYLFNVNFIETFDLVFT